VSNFGISKSPGFFNNKGLVKKKPTREHHDGKTVHKLQFVVDVFSANILAELDKVFPGIENQTKAIAAAQGKGTTLVAKQKLGVVAIEVRDFREGNVVFTDPIARAGIPRVIVGDSAKTAELRLDVEIDIPKSKAMATIDYFKADVLVSVAIAQLELPDGDGDDDGDADDDDGDDGDEGEQPDMFAAGVAPDGTEVLAVAAPTVRRAEDPEVEAKRRLAEEFGQAPTDEEDDPLDRELDELDDEE
jgi:hypothetical protein